jgi:DNA-binding HxlR family transcriptional regulator
MRDRLGIAPTMLTKRLNRLADEGFLTRETLADDGRGTLYRPTAAALPLNAVIASVEAFVDRAPCPFNEPGGPPDDRGEA